MIHHQMLSKQKKNPNQMKQQMNSVNDDLFFMKFKNVLLIDEFWKFIDGLH